MRYIIILIFLLQGLGIYAQNADNFSCDQAVEIQLGNNCFVNSNTYSTISSNSSCNPAAEKDIWYQFTGNLNTLYRLEASLTESDSLFNKTLTIYSGNCGNLQELTCFNNDEYGFVGEVAYLDLNQSATYFVKISGLDFEFGRSSGLCCLALSEATEIPPAAVNDLCEQATMLYLNDDWQNFKNINASIEGNYISPLERNRADIWFVYEHTQGTDLLIESKADFSHTIGLYQGACTNLNLLEKSLSGFSLSANDLLINESYYIQISGCFSTLEGDLELKISSVTDEIIDNDHCFSSISYEGDCHAFTTPSASFSGQYPDCLFHIQNDLWFDFTPEVAGTHKLNILSDFLFTVALYQNECDSLEILSCQDASPCNGALDLDHLIAGKKYLIQILSSNQHFVNEGGAGCLEITPINDYDFYPLSLEVSTICISDSTAILDVTVKNAQGNYTLLGNTDGQELTEGSPYFVQVTDEMGCQRIEHGSVSCAQPNNNCDLYFYVETTDFNCSTQTAGTATLTVYTAASYDVFWSTGDVTNTVSNLAPGQYSIAISNSISGTCNYEFEIIEDLQSYQTFYADLDADGFGDANNSTVSCNVPNGFVNNAMDCDDNNTNINPDISEEVYNGIDDDCDPSTLDDDLDQDGFVLAEDCDDTNANINPDAIEIANNGIDEDCNGSDLTSSTYQLADVNLNIYPNPVADIINIEFSEKIEFSTSIYNTNGILIKSAVNDNALDVYTIPNGSYFLEIKDIKTGQKVIEKIIVFKY